MKVIVGEQDNYLQVVNREYNTPVIHYLVNLYTHDRDVAVSFLKPMNLQLIDNT